MSQPLRQSCTDFEAYQFFKDCKDEIRRLAKQTHLQKNTTKSLSNPKISAQKPISSQSQQSQQSDPMLLNNIIIDCLRSRNYNYTYSVFMRQANIISQEIVNKSKIASLIGLETELQNDERFNVPIVELMLEKLGKMGEMEARKSEFGIQVQLVNGMGIVDNVLLMENKMREVREQVQGREKKYYEKLLESMRSKQILQLRNEITKQVQDKYTKQKQKLNKKYQQLIEKAKSNENPSKLKQQNQSLLNKNFQLTTSLTKAKQQLEILKKDTLKHDCKKNPQYLTLFDTIKSQRLQLQQKKQQLDYALRNLNTKVQDLVLQKQKINGQKKSDTFMQDIKVRRENKDHLIETIHAEMKQMEMRVKVLAEENQKLRESMRGLKMSVKEKEEHCKRLEEEMIYGDSDSVFDKKKTKKQDHISPPIFNAQQTAYNRPNSTIKCPECKMRKLHIKITTKDISIGVKQEDLLQNNGENILPEVSMSVQESESDFDQFEDQKLEHNRRLAIIKAEMNVIRKKVLLLVDNPI